jgi:hypothetical protein
MDVLTALEPLFAKGTVITTLTAQRIAAYMNIVAAIARR